MNGMTDFNKGSEKTDTAVPTSNEALERQVLQLEKALLEYVERYGLTDMARDALREPK